MAAEWHQLLQSVFIGLIFSYLLAKLISIVVHFKEEDLSISRNNDFNLEQTNEDHADVGNDDDGHDGVSSGSRVAEEEEEEEEEGSTAGQKGSIANTDVDDDADGDSGSDSDWEGVETTELDEAFSAASAFVATAAADRLSQKVSADKQLQLYGFYKIATEGPCTSPQPSALKMTARAKWQAWQKLGAMAPEEAMQKYVEMVTELYPMWLAGSSSTVNKRSRESDASSGDGKGPMGPVFSSLVYEEETQNELDYVVSQEASAGAVNSINITPGEMDAIHACAREGEVENLLKCIESGVSVNVKDSEGRTPLHWAVDRGQFSTMELLISNDANVNAKDNEGQTPLHYAAVCEREVIAEYLVKHNADTDAKDDDGNTPSNLCNSKWSWMPSTAKAID